eukprot:GFUD01006561.1.p1 GENE.GFUD01006561.1~~GFUD01006561.1.p1  ORF type:complete len:504 (-),score=175.95 GFUD01006561.1:41-1552(-)
MPPEKKAGFDFYRSLGSPVKVVAPMVDASELAWRMLARKFGAELCFTPMIHSGVFVRDKKYRVESLQTCPADRPLVLQFCANDPEIFLSAVTLALEDVECDAVDLNLGCPQIIAKRGHFGSFLQDEWELLTKMVSTVHQNTNIPVTVKVRVFPEVEKTVKYAQMLESAGAQMITVHGRTREQKGPLTGLADWEQVAAVKKAVKVPVIANGNIQNMEDVERCLEMTGVEGVMSAEGHLTNPAIFAGLNPPVWEMCLEYLQFVQQHPCPLSYVRGHLFKMLHHVFTIRTNFDLREVVAKSHSLDEFKSAVEGVRDRYIQYQEGDMVFTHPEELEIFHLKYPPWICQPYVRPPPEVYLEKMRKLAEEERREREEMKGEGENKRSVEGEGEETPQLSKKKQKKLERNPRKAFSRARENSELCCGLPCNNPCSLKCTSRMCRKCCKEKAFNESLDCEGHRVFIRSNREKAKLRPKEVLDEVETVVDTIDNTNSAFDAGDNNDTALHSD